MHKYRVNKAIEQITLIAGNIRTFFGPQKNYIGVRCSGYDCDATDGCWGHSGVNSYGNSTTAQNGCPIIKKAKILPDEMITLDSTGTKIMGITNPFGGAVNLGTRYKSIFDDNRAFYIIYELGDNTEACIELLSHDWSVANANIVGYVGNDVFYLKSPISIDDAVTVCSYDETSKEIGIYFDVDVNSSYWKDIISECSIANGGC